MKFSSQSTSLLFSEVQMLSAKKGWRSGSVLVLTETRRTDTEIKGGVVS